MSAKPEMTRLPRQRTPYTNVYEGDLGKDKHLALITLQSFERCDVEALVKWDEQF